MNRRGFVQLSSLASASLLLPDFLQAFNRNISGSFNGKRLVVIQLGGGNDGLNTFVPIGNDDYYRLRPGIGLKPSEVLRVSNEAGFHPSLSLFKEFYDSGELSVISSVGYPNPNRSHFRSMDIWHSASDSDKYINSGWLGRYLDSNCTKPYQVTELDSYPSLAIRGEKSSGMAFRNPQFLKNALQQSNNSDGLTSNSELLFLKKSFADIEASATYISTKFKTAALQAEYPKHEFGIGLSSIAKLIVSGTDIPAFYISLSGFDTHVLQLFTQQKLFNTLTESLKPFLEDLKHADEFKNTAVLIFSEFGRRVKENSGKGTDHGAANYSFILSGSLKKAGLYNTMPNLNDLDDGDIKYKVDFRSIYATLLKNWLAVNDEVILGENFKKLSVL